MLDLLPFSPKGLASTRDCDFLTVWEGSVRSSKTICSLWSFMWEVIRSPDPFHLMVGKDQSSVMGNCIESEYGLVMLSGGGAQVKRDKHNKVYVDLFGKHIDIFGGENVSSFKAFRGRSYGMVYNDEVNLQHPNTVEECFNRTLASKRRKHFWTLNPDVPNAYIYKSHLDVYDKEITPGYRWYHFTLDDNPAITEERKEEIKRQYHGIFYQRYILGLRVRAEGICFPGFLRERNVLHALQAKINVVDIGVDIGKNKSATTCCATGYFKPEVGRLSCVVLDELYYAENKDTEAVIEKIYDFIVRIVKAWPCLDVYVDSEEQLVIKSLRARLARTHPNVSVHNSLKKPINERIRFWDVMFATARAFIMDYCKHNIEATESAVWNPKMTEREERLDDGTTDIDTIDAREYSAERRMRDLIA